MAAKYQLDVVICLHGAPGSQNGHDHSGRKGRAAWYDTSEYRVQTTDILVRIATRYRLHPALWGIELLNEPKTMLFQGKLRMFYRHAYSALQEVLPPTVRIIFSDAFMPNLLSGAIRKAKVPVMMDIHWYHFTYWAFRWTPLAWYYKIIVPLHRLTLKWVSRRQPVINYLS